MVQSQIGPNSIGYIVAHVYASGYNSSTGHPQHITGMYLSHGGTPILFGTSYGTWYSNSIIHGGNISSQSVSAAANADTVDGKHASDFALSNHSHSYLPLSGGTLSGGIDMNGSLLIRGFESSGVNGLFFRNGFTSGNRAYNASILAYNNTGGAYDGLSINGCNGISFSTGSDDRNETMILTNQGRLGIGTHSPSDKLEVNGNIKATSFIKSGGTSGQFLKADGSVDSNSYSLSSHSHSNYLQTEQVTEVQSNITWAQTYGASHPKAFTYNTSGAEWSYLFGFRSDEKYGAVLKMGYTDKYLRILRVNNGTWQSSDWEKISAGYADSAGDADTIDGQDLMTKVSDWNTATTSIFKSSENSSTNGPTTGFIYGTTLRFHRDTSNYRTDLVVDLYNDKLFFRRHTEGGYQNWREIIHSGNYTSYVNTTNYPGLNKTGTVTSITLKAGTGISLDTDNTAITTSGTRTITNTGVRKISIEGNYLRINTNGTNADLTIPYSAASYNSDMVDGCHASDFATVYNTYGINGSMVNSIEGQYMLSYALGTIGISNYNTSVVIEECTSGSEYQTVKTINHTDLNYRNGVIVGTPFYSTGHSGKKIRLIITAPEYITSVGIYIRSLETGYTNTIYCISASKTSAISTWGSWHIISYINGERAKQKVIEINTTFETNNIHIMGFRICYTNAQDLTFPGNSLSANGVPSLSTSEIDTIMV